MKLRNIIDSLDGLIFKERDDKAFMPNAVEASLELTEGYSVNIIKNTPLAKYQVWMRYKGEVIDIDNKLNIAVAVWFDTENETIDYINNMYKHIKTSKL